MGPKQFVSAWVRSYLQAGAVHGAMGGVAIPADVGDTRLASYPPPYPDAWYVVAPLDALGNGPLTVQVAGHEMVLFRDGAAVRAISAYCPHMGAHLGDGDVKDGCVRCPFHSWRLDGHGQVRTLPKGEAPGPRHRTVSWATDVLHGMICVYHRGEPLEPGPAPEPPYRMQRVTAIDEGDMVLRGEYDAGQVRMHLIEFVENSVDFEHFGNLHEALTVPWTTVRVPKVTIDHDASWYRDPDEQHVAWFEDKARLAIAGRPFDATGAHARIRLEGPGSIVRFDFDLQGHGRVVMYQTHTPLGPMTQQVRFRWYSERRVPRAVASFIVGNWVSQWRADVKIWERKIYRQQPVLARSDGPIAQLRRWYAQFYPRPTPPTNGAAPAKRTLA